MIVSFARFSACLMAGAAIFCVSASARAQVAGPSLDITQGRVELAEARGLPDAPEPQSPVQKPETQKPETQTPETQTPETQKPGQPVAPAPAATSTSGTATDAGASPAEDQKDQITPPKKSPRELAEEQLKQEKKQRIGILPNFNASYVSNPVPLTPGQKFRLMFSTEKDPATIGFSMFVALIGQAEGSHPGYGGGIGGYGKRFGQNYADTFDGAFWGNAVLPSLWHQDPRYFRLGKGKPMHRILYALSTNIRAKHDGTGKWQPNYSNLVGNLISGGISNLYLPSSERGIGSTFEGAFLVTAEGGVGSMLEEFWPDFTHYLQRRKQRKQAAALVAEATP